jgi:hypothetical protein
VHFSIFLLTVTTFFPRSQRWQSGTMSLGPTPRRDVPNPHCFPAKPPVSPFSTRFPSCGQDNLTGKHPSGEGIIGPARAKMAALLPRFLY